MFGKVKHIHFVGIGGTGMSGIAELLLNLGYRVTGSDISVTPVTERLVALGASIEKGHDAGHVGQPDVVVYSSAIKRDNAEIAAARGKGIPVIPRAEMLAELMRMRQGIAVGGAHGKTTTTWLVGLVMAAARLDPTIIVGGRLKALGTNAKLGSGNYLVAEADESDGSFLKLSPTIAVITTVDEEHLDHYVNLDAIKKAFIQFANKVPFYGAAVVCLDDDYVQSILPHIERRVITYGFSQQADVQARDVVQEGTDVTFNALLQGKNMGSVLIRTPGEYNVLNSLAAIAVGLELDIPFQAIGEGLAQFSGISRRLEVKGEVDGVTVVDDYAHHPTELAATLGAIRSTYDRRIVAVFQPHRYTRTHALWDRLGRSFYDADTVIVTSIYAAGEAPIEGVSGDLVAQAAVDSGHRDVKYIAEMDEVIDHLARTVSDGDVVVTLGAGSIYRAGETLLERMKK
ncbi:MAG: UDP-N-acetylmuramate--L-alanine ligase [bacterium]|jgi:UDP-N-acetylmuramate--alanine ligase